MNFCNSRMSVTNDPEIYGSVIVTFYPDNVPVHYSVPYWELKDMIEKSKASIKLIDSKSPLTENNGN